MDAPVALFPALLGAEWNALHESVRKMHGDAAQLRAYGEADIDGSTAWPARTMRGVLGLPPPGARRRIEFTIARHDMREVWTRNFAGARMRSVLDQANGLLCERLGPMTFRFKLHRSRDAIDWELRSTRFFGIPLPRWMSGRVSSRSGAELDRYAFAVNVDLPLIGKLVAYRGWLAPADE